MDDIWHDLRQVFVEDHTKLTRAYRDILKALRAGHDDDAARIADEIDQIAGPHIEFEERFLYPLVREQRGQDYTDKLYQEHAEMAEGLRTLRRLLTTDRPAPMTGAARETLTKQMATGLEHATTCGTLLSHLSTRPEAEQRELLTAICQLRAHPKRWTDMT